MNRILFVFALFLAIGAYAQQPHPSRQDRQPLTRAEPERAAKAQELLTQARAALGQSAKLDDIKTLSVSGKMRRAAFSASVGSNASMGIMSGDVDPTILGADNFKAEFVNGKVEYDFSLPDKFRWQDEVGPGRRIGYFDGDHYWQRNNNPPLPLPPHIATMLRQRAQTDYASITLGLLLLPPPGLRLEYSYVGEKPFQQTIADVITITDPNTFSADLYLDQKTHLPRMLRFVVGGISRPVGVFMPHGTSRAEAMRQLEIAKQEAAAKPPGQQEREKLILFEDYRAVDGVLFPHKISTQINGKLIEELTFTKFKVNQPIKPEKFTEKQ